MNEAKRHELRKWMIRHEKKVVVGIIVSCLIVGMACIAGVMK